MRNAEMHFQNIKRVVENDFKNQEILIEDSTLEPAFLCDLYGIQGRLDILELSQTNKHQKIIELKSGGVPFPDDGVSIKPNHKSQLYLYYQLIALLQKIDFHKVSSQIDGYILYSKIAQTNLRYDKPTLSQVQEILNLRNKIIINEYYLTLDDITITKEIIAKITPDNLINGKKVFPKFKLIIEKQINDVIQPFKELDEIEENYF